MAQKIGGGKHRQRVSGQKSAGSAQCEHASKRSDRHVEHERKQPCGEIYSTVGDESLVRQAADCKFHFDEIGEQGAPDSAPHGGVSHSYAQGDGVGRMLLVESYCDYAFYW